jgi:molecular chaperone DnaK (HSP70)
MKTKLDPVLANAKTSSPADEEALRQARAYWKQVQEVMEDFGSNRIGPITAKQKLYQLTGKESIQEVIDEMGVTMQGAVIWGR